MAVSRKYHGNSRGVSGGNHFLVADGASGLDAGGGSGVNRHLKAVCKREHGVGRHNTALQIQAGLPGLPDGNAGGIHTAHLPGADAKRAVRTAKNDGVGMNLLHDAPVETHGGQFFLGRGALGHHLGFQIVQPHHVRIPLHGHEPAGRGTDDGFAARLHPVSGKDRTPSSITDIDMREKYFAPFKAAIRAGALSLMVNSANNSGVAFHANKELLTGWLKEDLNWDGMIVTDWNDINNLYFRDHIASSKKDAVRLAVNAGIDMAMIPSEGQFCIDLKELVEEGAVSMERIDDAVRRVLRLKFRLGLFENPYWDIRKYDKFGSREFAEVALQAARESEVLLKNEGELLPLRKGTKILLAGPNANAMRCLNGGWSYSWQGELADEFAQAYNTIYEALCNKFGTENIIYEPGVTYVADPNDNWWKENRPEIGKAVTAAGRADVIIACIGENTYCETPGNLNDLNLSSNQKELVRALAATGKPVILVLNEGRPRIIHEIEPLAKAVVHIMLPGNYGGDALADLIAGDANFSAKLPFTYPKFINSLATYDYKPCEQMGTMEGEYNYDAVMDIQWPFGHGLSYTSYEYSNFKVNRTTFNADDELIFEVDVKNVGERAGKETVLLYSSDLAASVSPDVIRLRYFEKVELQPGETKKVVMKLKGSDLAFVGQDRKWRLEQGRFRMKCGSEILYIDCEKDKIWDTPNID